MCIASNYIHRRRRRFLLRQHIFFGDRFFKFGLPFWVNKPVHDWVTTLLAIGDGPLLGNNNFKSYKTEKEIENISYRRRETLSFFFPFDSTIYLYLSLLLFFFFFFFFFF
jgi:hypothetical protein